MDIDTGSGDFWLPSQECEVCDRHKKFNPTASSTYQAEGRKWGISFGDGSFASGYTVRDTVTLGSLSLSNQVIGLATDESHAYQVETADGILGLSYSGVSFIPGITTVLDNAVENNIFSVFSIYLREKDKDDVAGELHLGGFDHSKFKGELTWIPLYQPKFWQIIVDSVSYIVKGVRKEMEIKGPAIIDSGSTVIVMSDDQVTEFYKVFPSAENSDIHGWILPCNTDLVPGDLSFTIGGVDFDVPVKNLVREPVRGLDGFCLSDMTSGASNFIILGDISLRSNYIVFDRGNARVGIASAI